MDCENLYNQIIRIELTIHQNSYFELMDKSFLSFCLFSELHVFYFKLIKDLITERPFLRRKNFYRFLKKS